MSWLGALMAPPRAAGPPPDGGSAAWLRLAAYWLVCAGTLGLQYTSGLLLVELLAEFGKGRAQTAIVGSASTGVMDFFGFFVGDVIVRLGERSTCLVGALLAGLGIIASAHATELWHLCARCGPAGGAAAASPSRAGRRLRPRSAPGLAARSTRPADTSHSRSLSASATRARCSLASS